jgi:hypothetical protein
VAVDRRFGDARPRDDGVNGESWVPALGEKIDPGIQDRRPRPGDPRVSGSTGRVDRIPSIVG